MHLNTPNLTFFCRFHSLNLKIQRETREKRRFYFEREWMTIAVPDGAFERVFFKFLFAWEVSFKIVVNSML